MYIQQGACMQNTWARNYTGRLIALYTSEDEKYVLGSWNLCHSRQQPPVLYTLYSMSWDLMIRMYLDVLRRTY